MPLIPLEDNFADIIQKAQRGRNITDERLASVSGVTMEDLLSAKAGKPMIAVVRRISRHLRLNPDAMETLIRKEWYPKQPGFPRGFSMFNTPYDEGLTVNSYLIWDAKSKDAIAFDTGTDCRDMLDLISAERLRLSSILVTHNHEDHVADLERLSKETGATVFSHELEPLALAGARAFKENVHFHAGSLSVKTILTSGHSPGLTSFFVTGLQWPLAIVGDSIFAGSMGGSVEHFEEQLRNNKTKLFSLPRDTILAPGHGPLTSLLEEKAHNPFYC
jgi:hydroxyacylglutathione hydrolase